MLRIYSSPWLRARQTAENLKKGMGLIEEIIREDPRIREQEWGNYQEKELFKKIMRERRKYGSFFYRIPQGESGADVYDRVTTFIDTLHRDFDKRDFPENVIIVSHGLTIKAFLMRWFHWSVEAFDEHETPKNCSIIRMVLQDNNRYKLIPHM